MHSLRLAIAPLIAAALLAGCASPAEEPVPVPSTPAPSPSAEPTATPSAAPAVEVEIFFAHVQPARTTLMGERQTVDAPEDATLDAILGDLISGEIQPLDPDYANLWGAGSALLSASSAAGVLEVDLRPGQLNLGAEAESVALAQLIWTAVTIDPTITAVQVLIEGTVAETLAGHVDISAPMEPGPAENSLSPVQITVPAEGSSVSAPVMATGVACVFEATFSWELEGPGGTVVDGVGMAAEACPARADWTLELGDLAPGDYVLTVIEYSMEDGDVSSTDSKAFTVTG